MIPEDEELLLDYIKKKVNHAAKLEEILKENMAKGKVVIEKELTKNNPSSRYFGEIE